MHPFEFTPSLILPIARGDWPPPTAPVTLDGITLQPKPELHVTLVGTSLGEELLRSVARPLLHDTVARALATHDTHPLRTGVLHLLRKPFDEHGGCGMAHSLIEYVHLPAMAPLHAALGRLLGRQLPVPPPHVTLYTAGDDRGIGVPSPTRLRALCVRLVEPSELER
ncbi:hypothetical protein [Novilysobacter selenitireducens]|uniref:Uncharacterized protein n=1 Tax=Novilysobacter selenitireducens TaxID=2872639 RepID=A0ABS7T2P0_9GAMM|nr:hypothetical protein [Lysobacter selenitireducens]MBZ4038130.1 hypothetical protein [Lysobacter selenitireducens]